MAADDDEHHIAAESSESRQPTAVEAWHGTVFTNAKAGMAGVDADRVKQIVYQMSKNSPHFKNEQRKQQQTEQKIARMQARAKSLSPAELDGHTRAMDAKLAGMQASMDLTRTWIVVDMDAFFASVEELDDPSLKSKPMAVGGVGMITTANYAARKYGVRSAMPGFIGRRLCPHLVFVPPTFAKYTAAAAATRAVFARFDPDYEAGSLDEAYLDVTDYCHTHELSGEGVAEALRRAVREETRLTCSCGIGPNRLLAKVAADLRKPDGQFAVRPDNASIERFVTPLPLRKVPGIGKVSEAILKALGVETCGDLLAKRGMIAALFSEISTDFFMEVGLGIGRTRHGEPVKEGAVGRKGISVERTFAAISSWADLEARCTELTGKLAEDLAAEGLQGRTVTLKLKTTAFALRTRAVTLPRHVSSAEDLLREALKLLRPELPITIRLMGIRVSGFLETHTEDGQSRLDGFLRPNLDAGPPRPPPRPRSWIQTFLGREAREEVDRHLAQLQAAAEAAGGDAQPGLDGAAQAAPDQAAQQQQEEQAGVGHLPVSRANDTASLGAARDAASLQERAGSQARSQQLPDASGDPEGLGASQGRAAEGGGLSQSQGVELSLRDWAPATAAAILASQQEQAQLPGSQQPGQAGPGPSRFAADPTAGREGCEERTAGVQEGCRDVLDEDEAEPCLQHPWEEAPGALGEAEEGPGAGGAADALAGERPAAPRLWQCQVCTFAGNRLRILRCEVCDAVRGTAWDYFMGGQAQQEAAGSQHRQQDAGTATNSGPAGREGATAEAAPAHAAAEAQAAPVSESTASRDQVEGRPEDLAGSSRGGEGEQEGPRHSLIEEDDGAPGTSMWEGGTEQGSWVCRRCSRTVSEGDKAEHEDYHLALQLQEEQGTGQGSSSLSTQQATQPKKRKAAAKSSSSQKKSRTKGLQGIDAFLKRANTKCL